MIKQDNPGDLLRRRWRSAGRRCTIVSCHSHKGGQGRTLTCAHLALDLAGRHILERRAAPNILLVDLDWEAPGLSYMFSKDALPKEYTIETDEKSQNSVWSSVELLTAISEALKGDTALRKLISVNQGIPRSERENAEIMKTLDRQIIGGETEKRPLAVQIRTPALTSRTADARGRIYLLPATPIDDTRKAFNAMQFDVGAFISGLQETGRPKVSGGALLRLSILFLIRQFDLDYLLIDCRPGITPLGYMASTRLSDIVLIPTTTYKQALHGAKALLNLLNPSSDDYARGGPPYGPERLLLFYSNIFKTGWRRDLANGTIELSKSLTKMIDETVGTTSPNERSIETIVLPHVVKLEDTEQFVTPSNDSITLSDDSSEDEAEPVYLRGIQRLRKQVEEVFSAKVEGQFSLAPTEAMFRPHALDSLLDAGDLSISVLVEAGAFGEQPFRELVKDSSVAKKFQGRLNIDPIGIEHDELLKFVTQENSFEDLGVKFKNIGTVPDLVSFPHYMLGKLAQDQWILPLTFLDTLEDTPPLDFTYLHDNFYLADELCLHAGTPFAFPFSVLRKLLLVKKGFDLEFGPAYDLQVGEQLDLKTAGLRVVQRSLEIAKRVQGQAPLMLENDFDRVGVWYDWLEFVFAFGGTDFSRREGRGSDYGECRLNNIATIDGTFAYLNLFWSDLTRRDNHQTWYTSLKNFLEDPYARMTIQWSDIVTSEWTEISSKCWILPVPSALPTPQETIVEGWVIGIPYRFKKDNERLKIIKKFLLWFLSEQVQTEFARVGGNPSRKLSSEQLPEVLGQLHSALAESRDRRRQGPKVAPKITFPEAPRVIKVICQGLKEMVGWEKDEQNKLAVAKKMDELAREIAINILDGKSAYIPLAKWIEK